MLKTQTIVDLIRKINLLKQQLQTEFEIDKLLNDLKMDLETKAIQDLRKKLEYLDKKLVKTKEVIKEIEHLENLIKQEQQLIKNYLEEAKKPLADDKEIKRVEIIMLTYKEPDIESEAARRVIYKTKWPYKFVLFDNRPNSRNFAKVWNKLIKESTCDYVLIMDSDAFVETDGWLTKLMETFDKFPNAMVVGPVAGAYGTVATQQNMNPQNAYIKATQISGYCFLVNKKIFDKIGYFDEDFCAFGQDSDFFARVVEAGFEIIINANVLVYHGKGNKADISLKKAEREEGFNWRLDSEIARALFEKKRKERQNAR
ncbi:MAG TPA: glycosyltransferase [Candidatus Desulfofervidus auxilii]|uniref:Glycosyltransferase n=1 Tax=Desulfofervidus auxilii TaxID=1621989 RepID=A0A7C0YBD0_DESA2|nr:glycosyltransferase [Candidatus Desulfofervidus auxilii]